MTTALLAGLGFGLGFCAAIFTVALPCAWALVRLVRWLDSDERWKGI